ncbi:Ankyrin repeat containing protein [Gracilaria domingensis]|nr:Ankyrin repeat containing protein [Gracilaria domingensis]
MAAQPTASSPPQPVAAEANPNPQTPQGSDKAKLDQTCAALDVPRNDDKLSEHTPANEPSNPDENEASNKSRKVTFGRVEEVPKGALPAPTAQDEESDDEDEDYTLSDGGEDDEMEDNIPPEQLALAMAEVSTMLKGRLKSFIDSGTLGSKPLHAAAASDDVCKLRELLSDGSEYHGKINDVDVFQYNALHVAAERGCVEACKVLIELGIDKDATTRMHKSTALHYVYVRVSNNVIFTRTAAFEGHDDVIAALLEAGVVIDAVTDDGRTALYQASLRGHAHCVDLLLRNGANRDIKAEGEKTAAQVASKEGVRSLFQEPAQKKARTES